MGQPNFTDEKTEAPQRCWNLPSIVTKPAAEGGFESALSLTKPDVSKSLLPVPIFWMVERKYREGAELSGKAGAGI